VNGWWLGQNIYSFLHVLSWHQIGDSLLNKEGRKAGKTDAKKGERKEKAILKTNAQF